MSHVLICDPDGIRAGQHTQALQASGHEVVASQRLAEALEKARDANCRILVLGLDALRLEDAGLWGLVKKLAPRVPVIGLHRQPSEAICRAAARAHIAAVLPCTAPREVFLYAVEQMLRQNTA